MRVEFICPACRGSVLAPPSLEGEALDCPKCKAEIARWPAPRIGDRAPAVVSAAAGPGAPWHYSVNGTRRGPITGPQLRALAESGSVRPTDLVWRDGMPEWVEARSLPALFPGAELAPAPPPLPTRREEEDRRPRRRKPRDTGFDLLTLFVLIVGTLIVPLVGIVVGCIALATGKGPRASQGVGLLALGLIMAVVYYLAVLEHDFQERQRFQQQQQQQLPRERQRW